MRRLVISSPGVVELPEAETPEPGPGEVQVLTRAVSICGSDLQALAGAHPFITLPCMSGHEAAGIVGKTGEGVTGLEPGMRVASSPASSAVSAPTADRDATTCANGSGSSAARPLVPWPMPSPHQRAASTSSPCPSRRFVRRASPVLAATVARLLVIDWPRRDAHPRLWLASGASPIISRGTPVSPRDEPAARDDLRPRAGRRGGCRLDAQDRI